MAFATRPPGRAAAMKIQAVAQHVRHPRSRADRVVLTTASDLNGIHRRRRGRARDRVVGAAEAAGAHVTLMHDRHAIDMPTLLARAKVELAKNHGDYIVDDRVRRHPGDRRDRVGEGGCEIRRPRPHGDGPPCATRNTHRSRIRSSAPGADCSTTWCSRSSRAARPTEPRRRRARRHGVPECHPARRTAWLCHGDPATSATGDGKDAFGFPMENWKVGDIHGAFEVRTRWRPFAEARAHAPRPSPDSVPRSRCSGSGRSRSSCGARSSPVRNAVQILAEGQGDLRIRLAESTTDEIGELGSWVNKFIVAVQGSLRGSRSARRASAARRPS